jgi:hypothetical protein
VVFAPTPAPAEIEIPAAAEAGIDEFDLEDFADEEPPAVAGAVPAADAPTPGAEPGPGLAPSAAAAFAQAPNAEQIAFEAPGEPAQPEEIAFEEIAGEDDFIELESDLETLIDGDSFAAGGDLAAAPADAFAATGDTTWPNEEPAPSENLPAAAGPVAAPAAADVWDVDVPPEAAPLPQPGVPFAPQEPPEPPPWAVAMIEEMRRLRQENSSLREALRHIHTLLDRQIEVLQEGRDQLEQHVGEFPGETAP